MKELVNSKARKYFDIEEDFIKIIEDKLSSSAEEILEAEKISTGWTNIVYEVKSSACSYFFRFPRDNFWSETIIKDYEFAHYIKGKTSFDTSDLQLNYFEKRPYSLHEKIDGETLADLMEDLNPEEVNSIAREIAWFMYELHQLEFNSQNVFKLSKNIPLKLRDFLDLLLTEHVADENIELWHHDLQKIAEIEASSKEEPVKCLVHGDFNSSNIIIDADMHIAAIIDFGFGGFGDKYDDIARIIGRVTPEFKEPIISAYSQISGEPINIELLEAKIKMWDHIDNAYIEYMKGIGIY